ncbi:MAG: phosphatidylglycerol lysyltransferase domain-containing protein [Candidatus Cloacimonetes bacterium]|jgi:hypothetical protein|nr:phosphatidylglycerol lysyltransferase domain-containing protein [Candidatus Cloacimonadota bacterium]MCB5286668.1 phosphatidylglycerol lysyltransferase domain-containing protein [Candidatus Cloacimonadota bacterium]MCK9184656.1 phosphatidylglycerol lysyltransferase domain-containing protein [Candidatus Cloacimonadota bacterium]MCK9584514.1 phosphatidylglycerol lysyltransferase domain-containing protein [Candidatus Cloacimonadota bacterium]MDY0228988.1 phosphatidylglycerol lysyltransferase do
MTEHKSMPGLNPLQLSHTLMLREYLSKYPRENCDYTITNLIVWGEIYDNHFLLYKERLVIFNPQYQYVYFPVGEYLSPLELKELLMDFRQYYPEARMILLPKEYIDQYPAVQDYFELNEDRDWADYIYSAEEMVEMRGKKLAKKKNLISQFRRAYPSYKVMKITEDRLPVIMNFTHKWRRDRDAEGAYLVTELQAIENTLKNWNQLPVEGIIICLQHKIAAYSIFSPQTLDMATVHFEKFDPFKKGSAQVVTWETARYLQGKYQWINREQDIGLPGLRHAKMSYAPDRLAPFFGALIKADS